MYKPGFGNIPNRDKIKDYLETGYANNPGDWVIHLWTIGKTASNMADDLGLDKDIALACGALHDIGKSLEKTEASHFLAGYKILRADSYLFPARIALTHSFQLKNVDAYVGDWNVDDDTKDFVRDYLQQIRYNDYDLLIQLLDGLIKTEYLGIEERAAEVKVNHGANPYFEERKQRLYELEEYFQNKLERPIKDYLPKVKYNKFPYNLLKDRD